MAHHPGHRHPHQRLLAGGKGQLKGAALGGEHLEAAPPIPLRHQQAVESKSLGRHRRPQRPLHLLPVQGVMLLKPRRLGQHQTPRQIRLRHHQNPTQIHHQPQNHNPAEPIQQLPRTPGIQNLTDGAVEGIGRRPGEHLQPGGELALGGAHG